MQSQAKKSHEKTAELFHALGDTTRLEVLDLLRSGERCVCELTDALETSQSRLSFHLKVLKEAGIIKDRPEGRWIYYSIAPDVVEELEEMAHVLKEGARSGRGARSC